jgi:hypothetical protein
MAVNGEFKVYGAHSAAVVGDADQTRTTAREHDFDPVRSRVERVLDKFLDDRSRPFNNLARRDAVDEGFGQLSDGHTATREFAGL